MSECRDLKNNMFVKFNINGNIVIFAGERNDLLKEGGELYEFIDKVGFDVAKKSVVDYNSFINGAEWWETTVGFINRVGIDNPETREIIKRISLKYASGTYLNDEEHDIFSRYFSVIDYMSNKLSSVAELLFRAALKKQNLTKDDECVVLEDD